MVRSFALSQCSDITLDAILWQLQNKRFGYRSGLRSPEGAEIWRAQMPRCRPCHTPFNGISQIHFNALISKHSCSKVAHLPPFKGCITISLKSWIRHRLRNFFYTDVGICANNFAHGNCLSEKLHSRTLSFENGIAYSIKVVPETPLLEICTFPPIWGALNFI